MNYLSTRGECALISPLEMLKRTYSPEGGIYAPAFLPSFGRDYLLELAENDLRYQIASILQPFFDDLPWQKLYDAVHATFHKLNLLDEEVKDRALLLNPYDRSIVLTELCFGKTQTNREFTLTLYHELLEAYGVDPSITVITYGYEEKQLQSHAVFAKSQRHCLALTSTENISQLQLPLDLATVLTRAVAMRPSEFVSKLRHLEGHPTFAERKAMLFTPAHLLNTLVNMAFSFATVATGYRNEWFDERSLVHWMVPETDGAFTTALWYAAQMGIPTHRIVICGKKSLKLQQLFQFGKYNLNEGTSTDKQRKGQGAMPAEQFERIVFDVAAKDAKTMKGYLTADGEGFKLPSAVVDELRHIFAWSIEATMNQVRTNVLQVYDQTDFALEEGAAIAVSQFGKLQRKVRMSSNQICIVPVLTSPLNRPTALASALRGEGYSKGRSYDKLLEEMAKETGYEIPQTQKWDYTKAIPLVEKCMDGLGEEVNELACKVSLTDFL